MESSQKTGAGPGRRAAAGTEPVDYPDFLRSFQAEVQAFTEQLTEEIREGSELVTPASAAYYRNRFCLLFSGEAERLADIYAEYEPAAGRRLFCRTWMGRLAGISDCYPAQLVGQRWSGSGWGEAEDFHCWLDSFRRKDGPKAEKLAAEIICVSDGFLAGLEPGRTGSRQ